MSIIKNALNEMESCMSKESIQRSDDLFERELFLIKLSELREMYHIKQTDLTEFTQPAISKIESRNDIKLSTLIRYITNMDLELEIKVKPKHKKSNAPNEVMLLHT